MTHNHAEMARGVRFHVSIPLLGVRFIWWLVMQTRPKMLLTEVQHQLRVKHYSIRTEQSYLSWIRRFIRFHGRRHPREMGRPEVEAFLTYLAVERGVSASTQNQALAAVLFLYSVVLEQDLPWLEDVVRARPSRNVPVVMTRDEVSAVLNELRKH